MHNNVKKLVEECKDNGYNYLHVCPTLTFAPVLTKEYVNDGFPELHGEKKVNLRNVVASRIYIFKQSMNE